MKPCTCMEQSKSLSQWSQSDHPVTPLPLFSLHANSTDPTIGPTERPKDERACAIPFTVPRVSGYGIIIIIIVNLNHSSNEQ